MIDIILSRHIRLIKLGNQISNSINNEFIGFRNELVTDLLLDAHHSVFDDSHTRIDKFLEKMHIKFYQLFQRIELFLESNLNEILNKEILFLEENFPGLRFNYSKYPIREIFGVSYYEHISNIFSNLKKDITSNYKISISFNHPDSFLLDKFRGTRKFNYKDSIFLNYHNKLKTLIKSIVFCYSSEIRFFFFFNNKKHFPFFKEALPLSESKTKKTKTKLGTYATEDFSPQNGSDLWKGCLPHFNSSVTQIPLFSIDESEKHDFREWFFSKSKTFQKEVLGDKRFSLLNSENYSYSQVFDFSKSNISIRNL